MVDLAVDLSPIERIAWGRPNEGEAVITAHLGELVVLRQEAVAGVDGVSTAEVAAARMLGMLR